MQFFITIFKNLLGYDGLILILALVNGFYFLPKLKKNQCITGASVKTNHICTYTTNHPYDTSIQ